MKTDAMEKTIMRTTTNTLQSDYEDGDADNDDSGDYDDIVDNKDETAMGGRGWCSW